MPPALTLKIAVDPVTPLVPVEYVISVDIPLVTDADTPKDTVLPDPTCVIAILAPSALIIAASVLLLVNALTVLPAPS